MKYFSYVTGHNGFLWPLKRKCSMKTIKVLFFEQAKQIGILCNKENNRIQQFGSDHLKISFFSNVHFLKCKVTAQTRSLQSKIHSYF